MPVRNLTPGWYPGIGTPQSSSSEHTTDTRSTASNNFNFASSYIPDYSTTPILEGMAKYAGQMAPQVYQWGMDAYNKSQGNIDALMRNALTYANPQRIAQEMGMAQAGVQQGAEAGRQNALRDLQSFGIDPSSGRYAALDSANRVMTGAASAGAGNQQRMATEAAGNAMQNQAINAGIANTQTGYGASNAMNQLLGTGMSLKFPPLGNVSMGGGSSTSSGGLTSNKSSQSGPAGYGYGMSFDEGGGVPDEVSPSSGGQIDDVKANLTSGEFIVPKDVVEWKGQEFFYKLMAATRKLRATGGSGDNGGGGGEPAMGYGAG